MKERIILAPGLNGSELSKSLALNNINTINLRICSSAELAKLALMRCGISVPQEILSFGAECAILAEVLTGELYFKDAVYSDIQNLASAIRILRSLVTDNDEEQAVKRILSKGIFTEKNTAISAVYSKYIKYISDNNMTDAITIVKMAESMCAAINSEFFYLKEYPLSPLEKALINRLSDGKAVEIQLKDLFGTAEGEIKIESYKNCYGAANEVEDIISEIYKGKQLDKCTIAVADTANYGQLFFDYSLRHNIPATFGCGISVTNATVARLLKNYYHWTSDGFFSSTALDNMLNDSSFNKSKLIERIITATSDKSASLDFKKFWTIAHTLHFTNSSTHNRQMVDLFRENNSNNELCLALEALSCELAMDVEEFVREYTKLSEITEGTEGTEKLLSNLNNAAVTAVYNELKNIRNTSTELNLEDAMDRVNGLYVLRQKCEEGKLHITSIETSMGTIRENMYFAGLSAQAFPGSPTENYLLLDEDLNLFGAGAEYLKSAERVNRRRTNFISFISLLSSLDTRIYVSYAGLNVSELKKANASSLIYELLNAEYGGNASADDLETHIRKVTYFEPDVSSGREIGREYNNGSRILRKDEGVSPEEKQIECNLDKAYSPSALNTFFECPRRFMLKYLMGIKEPDDDNPFDVFPANDKGTIAHLLMEELANSDITAEDFLNKSEEAFDEYIKQRATLIKENIGREKAEFLSMMESAYDADPHRNVVLKEEDITATHPSGVILHGYPDRVEQLEDGSHMIVDFKTGRKVKHKENDIESCLQGVIYAFLMENKGYNISAGEFRYLAADEVIPFVYDDDMRKALTEKLEIFESSMKQGYFELGSEDACRYCKLGDVCGRV